MPKVIDFGIAKAIGERLTEKTVFTRFEQFLGTPVYTSPEQAGTSGLDVDTRSDIYALRVLLYELLTGRTPFEDQPESVEQRHEAQARSQGHHRDQSEPHGLDGAGVLHSSRRNQHFVLPAVVRKFDHAPIPTRVVISFPTDRGSQRGPCFIC